MSEGYQIRPVAELVENPTRTAETAYDVLTHGQSRSTPWMQKLAGTAARRVDVHTVSGATLFDGRLCCADALRAYEGRSELPMPFDVVCPGCGRKYRVRLDLVRRS